MPVPTLVTDLSTTLASNSPAGSENVFPNLDDYLRATSGFIASIRDNSGNGWVSPYLPLAGGTVSGATTFSSTLALNGALSGTGLTNYLASPAAIGGTVAAAVSSTNLAYTGTLTGGTGVVNLGSGQFYKDASGNVGIGTAAPSARLQAYDATSATIRATSGANANLDLTANATDVRVGTPNGVPLLFRTSNATQMTLDISGNVGIGTSSPAFKLDVSGSGSQFIRAITTDTSGNAVGVLRADYLGGSGGTNTSVELRAGNAYSYLLNTTNAPMLFGVNNTERLRIDASGNVGIGTAAPGQKLDVASNSAENISIRVRNTQGIGDFYALEAGDIYVVAQSAGKSLIFGTVGAERLRIGSSGQLGIGGANYGASGQVLTSQGPGAPPGWSDPGGAPTLTVVTATTQAAAAGKHYVLTNVAATTVTLPGTPTAGDLVWITVGNGLATNIVARNASNIQSLAEDLTLDNANASVQLRYINSTIGWTFV